MNNSNQLIHTGIRNESVYSYNNRNKSTRFIRNTRNKKRHSVIGYPQQYEITFRNSTGPMLRKPTWRHGFGSGFTFAKHFHPVRARPPARRWPWRACSSIVIRNAITDSQPMCRYVNSLGKLNYPHKQLYQDKHE